LREPFPPASLPVAIEEMVMRIVILGGAGEMGRVAVETAARLGFVTQIVVADRNLEGASAQAARFPGLAVSAAVDLRDRAGLLGVITGADVVLNAAGPFFELGAPTLEAAIEAGAHYLDICDDWEPTLDMLELGERARARGVTAVIGMGASPGLTNLLAMKAARALDAADELLTGWSIDDATGEETAKMKGRQEPSAAVVHWMQQLSGRIRVQESGLQALVKPLQGRQIAFPEYGTLKVWTVGHPEAVTLPRALPELKACVNVMTGSDEKTFTGLKLLQGLVDAKILSLREAARELETSGDGPSTRRPRKALPGLFGWASGRRDGRATITAAWLRALPVGGMGGATSVPLALALNLFAGVRPAPPHGVLTPEEAIDPDWFFDLVAPYCGGGFTSGAELVGFGELLTEGAR